MNKKKMIEKVIETLIKEKQDHLEMARYYLHKYEDAVEDDRSEYVQESRRREQDKAREMETLIDFMQDLHYETEVKAK